MQEIGGFLEKVLLLQIDGYFPSAPLIEVWKSLQNCEETPSE